jgi:NAD(P)-dependent dehydrogenase (short-subunit alcohol dehydrogenase family)
LSTAPEGATPLLVDNGRVVNVSTCLTEWVAEPFAVYASMKGAIEVLTRYWAVELGRRGIPVNTVAPGPTRTDFAGGYLHHDQAQQYTISQTALGRVGEAPESTCKPLWLAVYAASVIWGFTVWLGISRTIPQRPLFDPAMETLT